MEIYHDTPEELLRCAILELLNNITVAKNMLANSKYRFKNLSEEYHNFKGCSAYIEGMEWSYKRLLRIQESLKINKGQS